MYKYIKRLLDISLSIIGIIVSSPMWILTIIGIELSDPGPVFYIADRIGQNNVHFKMYKFRSMKVPKTSEESSESSLRPDENRIFLWGRIMRKLKLDELPQFLNVLKGDMSFVGPRPVANDQFEIFRCGKYEETKVVLPGLTSPGALYDYVYGDQFTENELHDYEKYVLPNRRELELLYISKSSFLFDMWLIGETAICVLANILNISRPGLHKKLERMVDIEVTETLNE